MTATVLLFDAYTYPVVFFQQYRDIISGFVGTATGAGFMFGGGEPKILLTKMGENGKLRTLYVNYSRLRPVSEGAKVDFDYKSPNFSNLITPYGLYFDRSTQSMAKALGISFSANKCVQIELAITDKDWTDDFPYRMYLSDIQNLRPVTADEIIDNFKKKATKILDEDEITDELQEKILKNLNVALTDAGFQPVTQLFSSKNSDAGEPTSEPIETNQQPNIPTSEPQHTPTQAQGAVAPQIPSERAPGSFTRQSTPHR